MGYASPSKRLQRLPKAETDSEHDSLLAYIKAVGPQVSDDAEILINGKIRNLKGYVRENWSVIKDQLRVARLVVTAVESATGAQFEREAA
jgi:hypothetical protein